MTITYKTDRVINNELGENLFLAHTAILDPKGNIIIGDKAKIWHYSYISSGVRIGDSTSIGLYCYIAENVIIGTGCKIQSDVSIAEGTLLENEVFVGPGTKFANVKNPTAYLNHQNLFRNKPPFTFIKYRASIGANCVILPGITIGEYSTVGAGTIVREDVPDGYLAVGNNPFRLIKKK